MNFNESRMRDTQKLVESNKNYKQWFDARVMKKELNYNAILIFHGDRCVGLGSFIMKKTMHRLVANIGEFMVDPAYPSQKQLLHKLAVTLETLAWAANCSDCVMQPFHMDEDDIRDLDYRRVHYKNGYYFRKKQFEV